MPYKSDAQRKAVHASKYAKISHKDLGNAIDDIMLVRKIVRNQVTDPIWKNHLLKKSNNALDILSRKSVDIK